ncbi:MAG: hypothetical protein QXJ55_08800 [Candidatus Caldarchaeum sp.]
MCAVFHEKTAKGSVTVSLDCVEYKDLFLRFTIPFHSVEAMRVVKIPWWVSSRGITHLLPFRKKLYIVVGEHNAFKPGKGVLFSRSHGFWNEVVVNVKDLESFIKSVEKASGRLVMRDESDY